MPSGTLIIPTLPRNTDGAANKINRLCERIWSNVRCMCWQTKLEHYITGRNILLIKQFESVWCMCRASSLRQWIFPLETSLSCTSSSHPHQRRNASPPHELLHVSPRSTKQTCVNVVKALPHRQSLGRTHYQIVSDCSLGVEGSPSIGHIRMIRFYDTKILMRLTTRALEFGLHRICQTQEAFGFGLTPTMSCHTNF